MGMDVFGLKPSAPAGEYIRANMWSWPPIYDLIIELCADLLDSDTLANMRYNEGDGPLDQKTCTQMANRFERWMEHHTEGHVLECDVRVTADGHWVSDEQLAEDPDLETYSAMWVGDEHLKRWIEFLRHCGGFEVW
jgi:hypothetical protein